MADTFAAGDMVKVTGTSKGKGFQGVVHRYGFHGHPATHGHKDQERMPGSIGAGGVQHVFKGIRMGGHMGDEQVSVKNLEIVKVDVENNIIYIRGAVPGARNGLVEIIGEGELKVRTQNTDNKTQGVEIENQEKQEEGKQILDNSQREEKKEEKQEGEKLEIRNEEIKEEKIETPVSEEKVEEKSKE
jgi:large subunit ribosomal protein L3